MCAVPLMPRSAASWIIASLTASARNCDGGRGGGVAASAESGGSVGSLSQATWAARGGAGLRHGVAPDVGGAHAARDGEDGGPGAREVRAVRASLEGDLDDRLEGEHVLAVLLVQLVLHRVAQRVELARGEACRRAWGENPQL
jgi:hypothetical protein